MTQSNLIKVKILILAVAIGIAGGGISMNFGPVGYLSEKTVIRVGLANSPFPKKVNRTILKSALNQS